MNHVLNLEVWTVLQPEFQKKLDECIEYVVKNVPNVEEIYLFGSCARGEAKWDSDVDIAVITKEKITDHALRGTVQCDLEWPNEDGVKADVIFRTRDTQGWSRVLKSFTTRIKN